MNLAWMHFRHGRLHGRRAARCFRNPNWGPDWGRRRRCRRCRRRDLILLFLLGNFRLRFTLLDGLGLDRLGLGGFDFFNRLGLSTLRSAASALNRRRQLEQRLFLLLDGRNRRRFLGTLDRGISLFCLQRNPKKSVSARLQWRWQCRRDNGRCIRFVYIQKKLGDEVSAPFAGWLCARNGEPLW
mgnify:CR=1 FL=1